MPLAAATQLQLQCISQAHTKFSILHADKATRASQLSIHRTCIAKSERSIILREECTRLLDVLTTGVHYEIG